MNQATQDFIRQHQDDDVRQLAFLGSKYPEVDMPFALDQIRGRKMARIKLPRWASLEGIIYPPHISMEQCSSESTALYKAELAARLLGLPVSSSSAEKENKSEKENESANENEVAKALADAKVKDEFIKEFVQLSPIYADGRKDELVEFLQKKDVDDLVETCIAGLFTDDLKGIAGDSLIDVVEMDEDEKNFASIPMVNLYFTRDPGTCIGNGININHMSTPTRRREAPVSYTHLTLPTKVKV